MCAGCSSTRLLACKRLVRLFKLREGRLLFLIWRGGPVGPLMQPRDERHRLGHARLGIRGCGVRKSLLSDLHRGASRTVRGEKLLASVSETGAPIAFKTVNGIALAFSLV